MVELLNLLVFSLNILPEQPPILSAPTIGDYLEDFKYFMRTTKPFSVSYYGGVVYLALFIETVVFFFFVVGGLRRARFG